MKRLTCRTKLYEQADLTNTITNDDANALASIIITALKLSDDYDLVIQLTSLCRKTCRSRSLQCIISPENILCQIVNVLKATGLDDLPN